MNDPLLGWLKTARAETGVYNLQGDGDWVLTSYAEIAHDAKRLAAELVTRGLEPGEIVCLALKGSTGFPAAFFGTLLAGGVPCPLPVPLALQSRSTYLEEVLGLITHAQPALLICSPELEGTISSALNNLPSEVPVMVLGRTATSGEMESPRTQTSFALLQFTAGSSAAPRGVRISRSNLAANILGISSSLELKRDEAAATWLPIYHDMGLVGCLLTSFANQMPLFLMDPEPFIRSPALWLRLFGEGKATLTATPPFALQFCLRRCSEEELRGLDFSSWRIAIVGAERIDPHALKQFGGFLGPRGFQTATLRPAYGLAEATLAVTISPEEEPRILQVRSDATLAFGERVRIKHTTSLSDSELTTDGGLLVSCGQPLPDSRVRIHGEDGGTLEEGVLGEIVVSGPSVAQGYWAGATSESTRFAHEELWTGDAGFLFEGQLYVVGRIGDSLKVRGKNLYAEDLENKVSLAIGIATSRLAVLLGRHKRNSVFVIVEQAPGPWLKGLLSVVNREVEDAVVSVMSAPRGTIMRTTSGKPRRRMMWKHVQETGPIGEKIFEAEV